MKFDTIELSDTELEAVYGGDGLGGGLGSGGLGSGGLGSGLGSGVGLGASLASATSSRIHSFSGLCDINIFSLNAIVLPIVNIADCTNQICANRD